MEQVVTKIFRSYYTQTIQKHAIQATDSGIFYNLNQYGFGHSFTCVLKSTYLDINGELTVATFKYPHLIHKVFSLSNTDFPNTPFSRNLTPRIGRRFTALLIDCVI
jgi:hypothetical protein